jgi:nicotinate-nucleotide pyrophosphorylase (carboxylating)
VFRLVAPALRVTVLVRDGRAVKAGQRVLLLEGSARAILAGERTALNFLQRLSGIATLTRAYVEAVRPFPVRILDTRKTTPGLRRLEKAAVVHGGGTNHRFGLFDRILIKDNHRAFWKAAGSGSSLAAAVRAARRKYPGLLTEIEVESEAELLDALEGRPDWVLLDNMTPAQLRRCVRLTAGRAKLEASGGITLRTARRVAATGVDALSAGALTHSARALDVSLDWL